MRFFGRRKGRVLDLTENYRGRDFEAEEDSSPSDENAGDLGFFGAIANTASQNSQDSSDYVDVSAGADEKRRKLAKRLMDMTEKIEDLANQIYHLQQRIEVVEKRLNVNRF